ncbi:MAG: end-binding protein Ku [Actinomycetota bacterium]|jgi:DNA end-binding protein Ku|nr:end-binding protein Ku [Actinomycetota bacterium]
MKALWKGAITFGLISIPVRLYSAVSEKRPKFHLMHGEDGGRIKYTRTCSKCGKEVGWDDLVRGYEVSKDTYVDFTDEELEGLGVPSVSAIDVVAFVPLEQIDPVYYNKTYYVAPEPSGLKAYRLLAEALEAEGQVGVAKVSFRDKEHLATIRLRDDVFMLETMYWPDEIREPEFEELDKNVEIRDTEVKMARQLVQQLSDDFHPEQFEDAYRKAVEELVEKKIDGQEITVAPPPEEEPAKVVDLMEALKASVEEAKKRRGSGSSSKKTTKKSTAKKTTAKRRASAS